MNPAVLAAVVAAVTVAGVVLVVVGLVGTARPAAPPSRTGSRLAAAFGIGLSAAQRRTRQALLLTALVATVAVWLLTGWPAGGLMAGLGVLGVPWLFTVGRAERQEITRLEAVEVWTRRLKDLVRTGVGLIAAIVTSARTAPAPIAVEVRELAAQLQAGAPVQDSLDQFADTLADFKADEVIAALKLHAGDRGQRLGDVLVAVADSAAKEVAMRRGVAAKRAEPRFVTRFLTCLTIAVVVLVFINSAYARPYSTTLGQIVLFAVTLVFVGLLAWIRRLTLPPRRHRFLVDAASSTAAAASSPPPRRLEVVSQ